ncbi:MAG: MMPL family transporter, partial [Catenulispora sp.]|nr:MMPL family transporter [Catenulispora sp.]
MLRHAAELAIRRPRTVVAVWIVVFVVGLGLGASVFGKLGGLGSNVPGSESKVTESRIVKLDPGADTIDALVTSTTAGRVIGSDPTLKALVDEATADVRRIPGVAQVPDPYQPPGPGGDGQVVPVRVTFATGLSEDAENTALDAAVARLRTIGTSEFAVRVAGGPLTDSAMSDTAQSDAARAEMISLPIVLLLLVVVFGGVLAASLPLVLAFCGVASTLLVLYGFSFATNLSVYSVQITTMLGLGLGVDYALLMVTRFKQERAVTADIADCVRATVSAAGRTVFFSGLTVAVSLVGLVVYPAPFLRSLGLASTAVVAVDMIAAVTLLPALLVKFGHRVKPASAKQSEGRWFGRIAAGVVRYPLPVLLVIGAGLLAVAAPASTMALSSGDARGLPSDSEVRQVYDLSLAHFPGHSNANPLYVLVENGAARRDYVAHLQSLPGVVDVPETKTYPDGSAVLQLTPAGTMDGKVATDLVKTIRAEHQGAYVTGDTARLVDFRQMLSDRLPYAAGVVLVSVFVLLFLFTGSVLIPLKAVLTNL